MGPPSTVATAGARPLLLRRRSARRFGLRPLRSVRRFPKTIPSIFWRIAVRDGSTRQKTRRPRRGARRRCSGFPLLPLRAWSLLARRDAAPAHFRRSGRDRARPCWGQSAGGCRLISRCPHEIARRAQAEDRQAAGKDNASFDAFAWFGG